MKWFVVKHGKKQVLEVSKAMVALVATGVSGFSVILLHISHYSVQIDSVLGDWESGHHKRSNFVTHLAHPVYQKHIKLLNKIEKKRKYFYRQMMAKLFELARLLSLFRPLLLMLTVS